MKIGMQVSLKIDETSTERVAVSVQNVLFKDLQLRLTKNGPKGPFFVRRTETRLELLNVFSRETAIFRARLRCGSSEWFFRPSTG